LVKDEQEGSWFVYFSPLPLLEVLDQACSHGLDPLGWAMLIPFSLGLVLLL